MWPFKKAETRIVTSDPYLGEFLGARFVARADIEKASGLAVAHRCVSVIAENLAGVPLVLYRKTDSGGREPATDHPLFSVLSDEIAPGVSAFDGREWLLASLLVYGNAFAKIVRNGRGQVTGLVPLITGAVTIEQLPAFRVRYQYQPIYGPAETILQDEMLHIRYRSMDGIVGRSPIQIAAATFGLAVAQTDQAGAQAENAFRPAGALVFPDKLATGTGTGTKDSIIQKFKERFVGSMKAGEVMILDGGAKFETFSFNSKDSEFLESRKLSNLDIARVYGVPPTVAGIVDNATYSNVDGESRALVQRCLAPMARRVESAMAIALLSPESRKTLFLEHDLDDLIHGDIVARYNAYRVGREGGWLSVNEIRQTENMAKIKDGDSYVQPLNYGALGAANDNKATIGAAA
ncbi:phage portal protein [Mesorhizobium sp. LCM 4577]|uniref:phage portal protein n=1 Tax=Mesorhizobium sp. LCM 4577 TaxID=1848288 RepID=UPI0008D8E100|nr:phage portal protein [Mesorhizobium sp. LCM 4577]OHV63848.1 phage portal protein [Mesorhizobium sp. LCM 4577]